MNLIIDQGNTAVKLAIFEGGILRKKISFRREDSEGILQWIKDSTDIEMNVLICSVTKDEINLSELKIKTLIRLDHKTAIPIEIKYKTPETLGYDRLANAVAMHHLNSGKNSLAIDLGTCIKYDLVAENGEYLGGNISPGMEMRFKALNAFTDKLPLLEYGDLSPDYGIDTATSIQSGVQFGIIEEINGFISRYTQEFGALTIFMTGGDSKYFDKAIKNIIFANPNLTLTGLNVILDHNVQNK